MNSGRCARCLLATPRCVCALLPRVETRTRLVIVRHVLERWKPSNTARLAALALPRCEIWGYGARGIEPPWERLAEEGTWLLFPGGPDGLSDAAPPPTASASPRQLVVLDGSWPQARRMTQRIAALRALPRLALPAPVVAVDRMRRPPRSDGMATLEAIARALELFEGAETARPIDALFAEVVRRSRLG